MSALVTQRRRGRTRGADDCDRQGRGPRRDEQAPPLFDERSEEPTLDELVTGAWDALGVQPHVPCPLCGGDLIPGYGAHARPTHARCGDCGTELS